MLARATAVNTKKEVGEKYPVSPICFNFYLEEVMRRYAVSGNAHQLETSEQLSIRR